MAQVSYALREDSNTIFLLQDAGRRYDKYCQIAVFGRNIIRPEFFRQHLYFAPHTGNVGKYYGSVTDVGLSIEDNYYTPASDYVAVIDSEVEFRVTPSVIRQLSKSYMPAWGVKSYLDYFNDRKSGILLFLRVYKVNQPLSPLYLEKGSRGSTQIFKLYDEYEEETTLFIDGVTPVISDVKFSYLKDEILHLLKVENSFIALYDDTENGLNSLQDRVIADRKIQGTHRRWENRHLKWIEDDDDDSDFDMAQLDYEAIYEEVLEICPSMQEVIDYARNIQAARLGEYDYYLDNIHSNSEKEKESFLRVFDMSLRSAVKTALYYHKRNGVDYEEAFQEACIGVMMAINKYNDNVEGLFPSYASMWMRQIMNRNLPLYDDNVRVSVHYRDRISKILKQTFGILDMSYVNSISYDELYHLLLNKSDCDEDEAILIAYTLYPAESIEEIIDNFERENLLVDESDILELMNSEVVYGDIHVALDSLTNREREVLFYRFGFYDDEEHTLEDIGKMFGVTRERIRQIEGKAKRKIEDFYQRRYLNPKNV